MHRQGAPVWLGRCCCRCPAAEPACWHLWVAAAAAGLGRRLRLLLQPLSGHPVRKQRIQHAVVEVDFDIAGVQGQQSAHMSDTTACQASMECQ
jgi:hypothetical protein